MKTFKRLSMTLLALSFGGAALAAPAEKGPQGQEQGQEVQKKKRHQALEKGISTLKISNPFAFPIRIQLNKEVLGELLPGKSLVKELEAPQKARLKVFQGEELLRKERLFLKVGERVVDLEQPVKRPERRFKGKRGKHKGEYRKGEKGKRHQHVDGEASEGQWRHGRGHWKKKRAQKEGLEAPEKLEAEGQD